MSSTSTSLINPFNPELNILLIEDGELEAAWLSRILEKKANKIDLAENARAAKIFLNRNRYQLILLSLWLPDMNGLDLVKFIRQESKCDFTPIIALTANKDGTESKHAREMGLNGSIQKPMTLELCQSLFSWLDSKEENKDKFFTGQEIKGDQ